MDGCCHGVEGFAEGVLLGEVQRTVIMAALAHEGEHDLQGNHLLDGLQAPVAAASSFTVGMDGRCHGGVPRVVSLDFSHIRP